MSFLFYLLPILACLHTVWAHPIEEESSYAENYGQRLAKKALYPYKDSLFAPFGFLEAPRLGQGQRKKAVDSTFIRFGRSSFAPNSRSERSTDGHSPVDVLFGDSTTDDDHHSDLQESSPDMTSDLPDFKLSSPQRFLLNHNGCRVNTAQELRKAMLSDPNCIRAFRRAKKETVNDTFIRFGKREAPPEKEFEHESSKGTR